LADHWDKVSGIFDEGKKLVMSVVEDIVDFIVPLWQDFVAFVLEMTEELVAWWEENWPKISKIIGVVFDQVMETIRLALIVISAIWDATWPAIEMTLKTVWEAIKLIIKVAWEVISGLFSFWLSVITGDWEGAWDAIKGIFTGIWDAIWEFAANGVTNFSDMIKGYMDTIAERFGEGFNLVKDGIVGIWDGMISGVKSGFTGMVNWVIDKLNFLIRKVNTASGFISRLPGINISQMQQLSKLGFGGTDLGGTFTVGDRGLPEVVTLPAGSSVTPLAPGDRGGGGDTIIHLNAPQNDPAGVSREIGWELTKRGLN
jgi:phage-related protein